jgi:hypothetical protein
MELVKDPRYLPPGTQECLVKSPISPGTQECLVKSKNQQIPQDCAVKAATLNDNYGKLSPVEQNGDTKSNNEDTKCNNEDNVVLATQYDEYLQIIGDKEELFVNEIMQYDANEALIHLSQLKNAIEFGEYTRECIVRENKQIEIALRSNILDWKTGLMSADDAMTIIETWTMGISANIESMEKVESNIKLITRVMDVLHARIREICESHNEGQIREPRNEGQTREPCHEGQTCESHNEGQIREPRNEGQRRELRNEGQTREPCNEGQIHDQESLIDTSDKYFFVTLSSEKEDGPDNYVSDILVKNFKSIFPESFPVTAYCYSLGYSANNTVSLNGLIRFDHRGKYRISPKSSHIKNIVISYTTGAKQPRPFNILNLTKYLSKRYRTRCVDIQSRYMFIENHGKIIGNSRVLGKRSEESSSKATLSNFLFGDILR